MAVVTPPLFLSVDLAYSGASLGLGHRDIMGPGVNTASDLAVVQRGAGANMSVDVGAGVAWVRGSTTPATQPTYRCYNDATVNVAVTAANPSNPRIDLIVARVYDASFSGGTNTWALEVVTGTPAASPSVPAAPASSLVLAQLAVAAGATSIVTANITNKRVPAIVGGGQAGLQVGCELVRTADQTISTSTWTPITWQNALRDPWGMWASGTPTRVTVPVQGFYAITHLAEWGDSAPTTGERLIGVSKNGTANANLACEHATFNNAFPRACCSTVTYLFSGDYVEAYFYQSSGVNATYKYSFAETTSRLSVVLVEA